MKQIKIYMLYICGKIVTSCYTCNVHKKEIPVWVNLLMDVLRDQQHEVTCLKNDPILEGAIIKPFSRDQLS